MQSLIGLSIDAIFFKWELGILYQCNFFHTTLKINDYDINNIVKDNVIGIIILPDSGL